MKLGLCVAVALLGALTLASAQSTIAELAAATPDLSVFENALVASGLAGGLNDSSIAVTAFAPSDAAFDDFAAQQNMTVDDLVQSAVIAPILQYHLTQGLTPAAQLTSGETLNTLLEGQNLTVTLPPTSAAQSLGIQSFEFVTISGYEGKALVLDQDLPAGMSLVNIIDHVLKPSDEAIEAYYAQA